MPDGMVEQLAAVGLVPTSTVLGARAILIHSRSREIPALLTPTVDARATSKPLPCYYFCQIYHLFKRIHSITLRAPQI
jgi:hypothetical protein